MTARPPPPKPLRGSGITGNHRGIPLWYASGLWIAAWVCPQTALALDSGATPAPAAAPEVPAPPTIIRLALSKQASAFLTEERVRRLIDLELPATTRLLDDPVGPLDENSVRIYVDLPTPTVVTIQVQAPGHRLEIRRVGVTGLGWDVAARATAISTNEAIRVALTPVVKTPAKPRELTDGEVLQLYRRSPTWEVSASAEGAYLPSIGAFAGSRFALGFHQPWFGEEISVAAMGGGGNLGSLQWFELALWAGPRIYFHSRVRGELGPSFALAYADIHDRENHQFTLRAAGRIGLDFRLHQRTWLGLSFEPGAIPLDSPRGLGGAWIGFGLRLSTDDFFSTEKY